MTNARWFYSLVILVCAAILSTTALAGTTFNGLAENQIDSCGYYRVITGGLFPTGTTPNGTSSSGGTFRYIADDPVWGYTTGTWHKDGWFAENAGLAVTLKNGSDIVYNNNGIETGTYGDYYNATAQGLASASTPGLYTGYSMSNNYDFIYAGYFQITEATTITEIIGYYDENSGFDSDNPNIQYRMNIWSNVEGDLLPVNTGSFTGDVFASSTTSGTFTWGDTGVDRVYGTDYDSVTDDIYYLKYTLDTPITLQPGTYWFSHDAVVVPTPGAAVLVGIGATLVGRLRRRRAM